MLMAFLLSRLFVHSLASNVPVRIVGKKEYNQLPTGKGSCNPEWRKPFLGCGVFIMPFCSYLSILRSENERRIFMLSYQKNYYKTYAILMEDGTEHDVSRSECFAKGEEPTEDNPYKQRWYYSPDREIAIRLPRSEKGEAIYRANSADLKNLEYEDHRKSACVGEYGRMCHISCGNCRYKDSCSSEFRCGNGQGCKTKCEDCLSMTSRFSSIDLPVGEDHSYDPIVAELRDESDVELEVCHRVMEKNRNVVIAEMLHSLSDEDKELCLYIQDGLSNVQIGKLIGVSEGTVRKRKARLATLFEKVGLKDF